MPVRLGPMAKDSPKGASICQAKPHSFANALRTTRSTLKREQVQFRIGIVMYRGFPERLHHTVPHWVEPGALFHIRIALDREKEQRVLTDPVLARAILDSVKSYEAKMRWHITLFLLMPDHLHALLSFARDQSMSEVIRDWKRFHARINHIIWQEGYFDHRLRADERGTQLTSKMNYIRQNPVAAGLCARPEDWPWVIDPFVC